MPLLTTRTSNTRSGWPQVDFLISPTQQRRGYGTELFQAVLDSWWALPRQRRRRQLHPLALPDRAPGATIRDQVVIHYEATDKSADAFFNNVCKGMVIYVIGQAEDFDGREGRERDLKTWFGRTVVNPMGLGEDDGDDVNGSNGGDGGKD